ncbi:RipA family octameric membrane protein [Phocaeicola sartorii]|uniref:RipA family octameric membrane protein n=1 Tax=Phocaeicola sartorii TaxID=671267 RepID=UPI001F572F2B|nr:hypothetical protein [Phocaeicola sartorii]
MLEKTRQSLLSIGEAIKTSASTAKEIKVANPVETAESVPLTTRDFYHTYWHCRDFELSHLWQRSIFLSAFLIICFSAYGYLALDMLEVLHSSESLKDGTQYWNVVHNAAILISSVGSILSILWIMMAKGSKAWYEIYEAAITAYETHPDFLSPDAQGQKIGGFQYKRLPGFDRHVADKLDNCLLSASAGAYSPSRINWAIGVLMLVIWVSVMVIHIIALFPDTDCSGKIWGVITAVIAVILCWVIGRKMRSKTIIGIYQK